MNTEENTLLAKWLAGDITPVELQQLQQEVDLPALERVLKQQKQFELEVRSNDEMWKDFQNKLPDSPSESPSKNRRWLIGLLLALAIITGLWFYFFQNKNQKTETAPAKTETKFYADGTQIYVSPNSSIEYNEADWENQRNIILAGQAFFDVTKGSPFVVNTEQGKIEVLGTQFDIWEMGNLMRVQCFEGSVKVSSRGKSKTLTPNQQIFVNKNSLGNVEDVSSSKPDWMQQQRVYQKMPLRFVLKDLERFYDIKTDATAVSIDDNFGGLLPTNDLNKALDYLTKSINWTYEIKDKTIYFAPDKE